MTTLRQEKSPVDRLSEIPPDVRHAATWSREKADLYAVDQYFREACWTFGDIVAEMQSVCLCMLKSEATVGRRLVPALHALEQAGFRPVDAIRFRHDRMTIREVWRYQFNIATRHRVEAMDVILPSTDTVALVLRDERWTSKAVPAAVRLNALKGPADPALRQPTHLRHQLGVVRGLFNFTHISDELADVMRELAVISDEARRMQTRERILADHDARAEVLEIFADLEARHPAHDFDIERSWASLAVDEGPVAEAARRRARGDTPSLDEMLALTRAVPIEAPRRWDLLTVVTHLLGDMNVPGVTPTVPNVTEDWRPGTVCPAGS
ncbi:nucleoside diphosphate kinase [Micromonospora sp. A202]|uniref:nucleoside-diphosphate kinase n=1 Tax=Micromonospora sp. A202 TaxID=2572899 RepID=UPI00117426E7|nr:nucleoside-diphosphate kinase [Micromonospora sp. A202]TQJ23679.1 nucleoside diphosphate kinase [Micromonospora sp. A202]